MMLVFLLLFLLVFLITKITQNVEFLIILKTDAIQQENKHCVPFDKEIMQIKSYGKK